MKAVFFALAAATVVSAQNFGAEPACAIPCLTSAISVAGCALSDEACQCGSGYSAIQSAVTPCLLAGCDSADLLAAASVGLALCSVYTASLAAAATAAPSSSAAPGSVSVSAASSTAAVSTTTSVVVTTSSAPSTTPKSNVTKAASPTSTVVQANDAATMVMGMGGFLALVAGVVAAL